MLMFNCSTCLTTVYVVFGAAIKKYMVEAAKTKSEKEKVKDVTVQNLINWGVVKNVDGTLAPTNAFVLLTDNTFPLPKSSVLYSKERRELFLLIKGILRDHFMSRLRKPMNLY